MLKQLVQETLTERNKLQQAELIYQLFIYFPRLAAINTKQCLISDICYKNFYYKTNPLHTYYTHTGKSYFSGVKRAHSHISTGT